jgi:predicted RNA-binding Zn-ribbon protein involved in translation (DUF1610 family)
MSPQGLVGFQCPSCGATVYTVKNATVGHMCKRARPRQRFVMFVPRGEVKA